MEKQPGEGAPRARARWKLVATVAAVLAITGSEALAQATGGGAAVALLNATGTMRDTLQRLQAANKPVELVLRNGKSYRGKLAGVGDHAVVVTEIEGREFFDAYIALEDITAVEVRARGDR